MWKEPNILVYSNKFTSKYFEVTGHIGVAPITRDYCQ